jgi:hypothetical protein
VTLIQLDSFRQQICIAINGYQNQLGKQNCKQHIQKLIVLQSGKQLPALVIRFDCLDVKHQPREVLEESHQKWGMLLQ